MVLTIEMHDNLMFFTNSGKVFQTKAYEIPESSRTARGQAIVNFLQLSQEEKITATISRSKDDSYKYLFMATRNGTVKKSRLEEFDNVRRSGLIAITLDKGDTLGWVRPTTGSDDVIMTTADGQSVRFKESDVRPMGRNAAGVRGMKHGVDRAFAERVWQAFGPQTVQDTEAWRIGHEGDEGDTEDRRYRRSARDQHGEYRR